MNDISPIEKSDLTQAVSEAAMLADVSISVWGGMQNDPNLMEGVKRQHGARGDVGKVIKYLMAGANTRFKSTRSAFFNVRNQHYKLTLPWVNDPHAARATGPRLLPHLLNPRYMHEVVGVAVLAANAELDAFVSEYPDLVLQAKANLGTMVSDDAYPEPEQLRELYRIHFDFDPLPKGEHFSGLDDHMLERLGKRLQRKQERQIAEAERAMWGNVRERIAHMVERLTDDGDEAKLFKTATIENVKELLVLLPGWNVTGNVYAEQITHDLDTLVAGLEPDELRKSASLRATTAKQTQSIIDKMKGWNL